MKGKKHTSNITTISSNIVANKMTEKITERVFRLFDDSEQLVELAKKWQNIAPDKAQGYTFEQLEVMKFNSDALKKNSDYYAKTTASMGKPTDSVDIVIKKGNKVVREVQAKSCNSANRTAFALSQKKYDEMLRLAPKEQAKKIEELLQKRINAGTLKAEDYEQTLRNLKKSLQYKDIASSGTTHRESMDTTDPKVAEKLASEVKQESVLQDMHQSGKTAGKVVSFISGSTSLVKGINDYYKGEKNIKDVGCDVIVDTGKGYVRAYLTTAMSKGIAHALSRFFGRTFAKVLIKRNAPVAIASGVVTSAKSLIAYAKGDITKEEMLDEVNHTAITSTASFYYGVLGQTVIPIPVVGAILGATVGYFIGNMLYQSSLIALGDAQIVKMAKKRRKDIQAICLEAIPKIQSNRQELEQYLDKHFKKRKKEFSKSFKTIDESLLLGDPDNFIKGLEGINNQFHSILPFKTFKEFDKLMKSEKTLDF